MNEDDSVSPRDSKNQTAFETQSEALNCPHQWFEVKKMRYEVIFEDGQKRFTDTDVGEYKEDGSRLRVVEVLRKVDGVLVKCANCLTSKELWE